MMLSQLIQVLADQQIQLTLEQGGLSINAPKGAVTPDILTALKAHKAALIEWLSDAQVTQKPITSVPDGQNLSLSFAQQRLWLLTQIDGTSAHYNIAAALKLKGVPDFSALERAFTALVERHQSLRSCIEVADDGQPFGRVQAAGIFHIQTIDLSGLAAVPKQQAVDEQMAIEANHSFDLSVDLMLRVKLVKTLADEHILLVTLHHIAADGWSMAILINQISVLYRSFIQGQDNPLAPLEIQYADYANWQRHWLQGEVLEKQLNYWTKQLANLPSVHQLPLDSLRPAVQTFKGQTLTSTINAQTTGELVDFTMAHDATLFMGLHAVFSVLLSRYSDEKDIVIGTPIANRDQVQVADLIGFFVNTLVLRCDLSQDPDFIALLSQSKSMLVQAYQHQQLPFEQIVERLQPQRSLSHSPLFQVMLVMQNNEQVTLTLPGMVLTPIEPNKQIAKYDLTLTVKQDDTGLVLGWQYNSDIFEQQTIARMAGHFELLLQSLLSCPTNSVAKANMLSDKEREQLLIGFNDTTRDYDTGVCIHQLFEAKVESDPDLIAVVFEEQQLSYAQLNRKANQLAHYLVSHKAIKPDALVGISLERSVDVVVAILAVLKSGGGYVPLDVNHPAERLAYMIEDARLTTVISHQSMLAKLPIINIEVLCLDDDDFTAALSPQAISNLPPATLGLTPNHLAYVIYTSGSTGHPKGVMIEHTSMVNLIENDQAAFDIQPGDRFLNPVALGFDAGNGFLLETLCCGATLYLCNDSKYLFEFIASQQITHVIMPPALLAIQQLCAVNSLKVIISGGDVCNQEVINRLHHNTRFINAYGPSENTVTTTFQTFVKGQKINIGKPIDNVQCYVLSADNDIVPIGCCGELYIGGVGLARGYLHREQLSVEKFVVNPFYRSCAQGHSPRLYKTGDLVRRLADGNLDFVGRIDQQVKIRGFRIELGEVQSALNGIDTVKDTLVMARTSAIGEKHLVAYVVANSELADEHNANYLDLSKVDCRQLPLTLQAKQWIDDLREQLKQQLAEYMVPALFVLLDRLPLTTNRKVDTKALPEPDMSLLQNDYVEPQTLTERRLCDIWQQLLGIERVGGMDNFFALGGHSLLVMQVVAQLDKQSTVMSARQLFATATLAELAKAIDDASTIQATEQKIDYVVPENIIPIDCQQLTPQMLPLVDLGADDIARIVAHVPGGVANIQDVYPLGPLQQGILYHHAINSEFDPYITPIVFKADNESCVARFAAALQVIVDRHDVLRTAIFYQDLSVAVQVVHRKADIVCTTIDIPQSEEGVEYLRAYCGAADRVFDITSAPLLKLFVGRQADLQQQIVLLQLHHIVSDHIGLAVIHQELKAVQMDLAETLPTPVPYREFIGQTLNYALHCDSQAFFSQLLGDIDTPTLPFGLADIQGDGRQTQAVKTRLETAQAMRIRQLAKQFKVSPAALFHSAWAMVVAGCSNKSDVVFGTVVSGRLQQSLSRQTMLGVFINTLPVRVCLGGKTARQLIRAVHQSLTDLMPYEQTSLVLAQQCSQLPSGSVLFSAMLNYRHSAPAHSTTDAAQVGEGVHFVSAQERTNYPFNLSVDDYGDDFALDVQVDSTIDAVRVTEYIKVALDQLLNGLSDASQRDCAAVSILPDAERELLLRHCNDNVVSYPQDKTIGQLFEANVAKTPNAVALICDGQTLSYAQLNHQANSLAHWLLTHRQLKPDTLVGVCLERSSQLLVTLLGILKAGSAYVPLNPSHPVAQLSQMVEDAGLACVISQKSLQNRLPIDAHQVLCLDEPLIIKQLAAQPHHNPVIEALGLSSNHLAYVLYTSGSTGKPKGVLVEHHCVVSLVINQQYVALSTDTKMLQNASVSFDAATFEIWGALLNGGQLIIQSAPLVTMDALETFINAHQINTAWLTAGLFDQYAELASQPTTSLSQLLVGGDVVKPYRVSQFKAKYPTVAIINGYGPTENTTFSCCHSIDQAARDESTIAIGKPLANRQAYVLNANLALCPLGVVGELYVGGSGLARGYLNRPELTRQAFIDNPFHDGSASHTSTRLYKTGDLVRWSQGAVLEFCGRVDHQVKIRGLRIELAAIEYGLAQLAGVLGAVVVAKQSDIDNKILVGYVMVAAEKALAPVAQQRLYIEQLKQDLSQQLPQYMVPTLMVLLEQLPLTVNGKVDRTALPDPDLTLLQSAYVAPNNDIECQLCQLWQELLSLEQVGITDNFFGLGGHSLLMTKLVGRINQQFAAGVSVKQLFSHQTVAQMAQLINSNTLIDNVKFDKTSTLSSNELELTI